MGRLKPEGYKPGVQQGYTRNLYPSAPNAVGVHGRGTEGYKPRFEPKRCTLRCTLQYPLGLPRCAVVEVRGTPPKGGPPTPPHGDLNLILNMGRGA